MKYGYIRVSKEDQNNARQLDGLKALCDELVIEKISATVKDRPKFTALLNRLKEGETLSVWSLDRAFRSTVDAIQQADKLRARGINFVIVDLNVDTATPSGMLVYSVMAAMAQFERENLIERTKQGLMAAKKRGVRLGRPPRLSHKNFR
jgi:DNA invertase Pin-like site-specific DNA recombinase